MGEDPGHYVHWQVANKLNKDMNDVTQQEIEKYGVITVLRKDMPQVHNRKNPHEDEPPHVEEPDYYSMDTVYPKVILTGKELITFLKRNSPEYLHRFK